LHGVDDTLSVRSDAKAVLLHGHDNVPSAVRGAGRGKRLCERKKRRNLQVRGREREKREKIEREQKE
jgi:hypothetical protein